MLLLATLRYNYWDQINESFVSDRDPEKLAPAINPLDNPGHQQVTTFENDSSSDEYFSANGKQGGQGAVRPTESQK